MFTMSAQFERIDNYEVSITMTTTVKEWRELMQQLPQPWPSWKVAQQIGDVLEQLEKQVTRRQED